MPQNETPAWWVEVEHVRESIERRRSGAAESAALGEPEPEPARRFSRAAADQPVPRRDELDWPADPPVRGSRRFERSGRDRADRADRGAVAVDEARVTRRRAAVAEAERASARGRRARTEADLARTRSHRADSDDGSAPAMRDPEARATATPIADVHARAADVTGRGASAGLEIDRAPAPAKARGARRTIEITGRTVPAPALPRLVEVERRRPGRRPAERVGPRPDRIALYAVLLGFFLIVVAALSAHAGI
jgi:hypothetical protein